MVIEAGNVEAGKPLLQGLTSIGKVEAGKPLLQLQ